MADSLNNGNGKVLVSNKTSKRSFDLDKNNQEIVYNDSNHTNNMDHMNSNSNDDNFQRKTSKVIGNTAFSVRSNGSFSKGSGGRTNVLRKKHAEAMMSKSKMNKYKEMRKNLRLEKSNTKKDKDYDYKKNDENEEDLIADEEEAEENSIF